MWGNALGWFLSLLMVAATATFVSWLNHVARATSPRTDFSRDPNNAALIELPVSPKTILPTTDPSDAAPIYRKAVEQYNQDSISYDRFARNGDDVEQIAQLPAIKILEEATNYSACNLFIGNPGEIVNYDNEKPALDDLLTLGTCARRAGQLIEKQQPEEAMKLYEAEFSLGEKLYAERLIYGELDDGLTLMAEGATLIGRLDPERAAAAKQFNDARIAYVKERILPMQRVIGSADQATLEFYAGDVFYFSHYAGDRMWRVESVLKLGRYRFNAGRVGDQRSAMKAINSLLSDSDPVVKTAATAARDLTEEKYRMMR